MLIIISTRIKNALNTWIQLLIQEDKVLKVILEGYDEWNLNNGYANILIGFSRHNIVIEFMLWKDTPYQKICQSRQK